MSTKICTKCSVEKPLTEFYRNKSQCKKCYNIACKNYNKVYDAKPENKKRRSKYDKKYKEAIDKNQKREYEREYYKQNGKKYNKDYYVNNIERFRWRSLLRTFIKKSNLPKSSSTQQMLGYSYNQLKEHLDKQGMDWNLHEIDHKIPLTWFTKNTPAHIVNDLRNLQPLTEEENKAKGNRFCSPTPKSYINIIKDYIKPKYINRL